MNRRSFIKVLTALAGATALPSFDVPVIDTLSAANVPSPVVDAEYSILWRKAYDIYRNSTRFRLEIKFCDQWYMVDCLIDSAELDPMVKQNMERTMARHVLDERGVLINIKESARAKS